MLWVNCMNILFSSFLCVIGVCTSFFCLCVYGYQSVCTFVYVCMSISVCKSDTFVERGDGSFRHPERNGTETSLKK